MKLDESLKNNTEALLVLSKNWPSDQARRDIVQAMNLLVRKSIPEQMLKERIHMAYIMSHYMQPEIEDVIAVLLAVPFHEKKVFRPDFDLSFENDRSERYKEWTIQAVNELTHDMRWKSEAEQKEKDFEWTETTCIDYYVMYRVCDKMAEKLIQSMNKKGIPDCVCIQQAYDLAKDAHKWVHRATGEPYLTHPLWVGRILCDLGVESDVVAAALLHDVVEDSSFDLSQITKGFGSKIAEYVDAVTSVDKEYSSSDDDEKYNSSKAEKDDATVEKLRLCVETNREMVFALYIKAADRIHNLQTLSNMPNQKKHAKIDQTEKHYLPLFKQFHLNYFVKLLDNLIWKTNNEKLYQQINSAYQRMLVLSSEQIDKMEVALETRFCSEMNNHCKRNFISSFKLTVEKEEYTPFQVYNQVEALLNERTDYSKVVTKNNVALCDFNIVLDQKKESNTIEDFTTYVVQLIQKSLVDPVYTIISLSTDEYKRLQITVEDSARNRFNLFFSTRDSFIRYRMGSKYSIYVPGETNVDGDPYNGKMIRVHLRDGAVREMPKGSSVLDLAFSIHEFIGLSAKAAIIDDQNDQPVDVYTLLHDKNKVEVIADTRKENGSLKHFIPHARVDWLSAVVTKRAQDCLIKYFERRYEGDNPRDENNTSIDNDRFNKYLNEFSELIQANQDVT